MAGKAPGADVVPEEEALRDLRTDMFVYVKFPRGKPRMCGDSATIVLLDHRELEVLVGTAEKLRGT